MLKNTVFKNMYYILFKHLFQSLVEVNVSKASPLFPFAQGIVESILALSANAESNLLCGE